MKLKLAYFGTPSFSAGFLEKILLDKELPVEVILIITQPDQPKGRKQLLTPSPVKLIAQKHHIPVFDDFSILNTQYSILNTCALALVYAYGRIIPKDLLTIPTYGFLNIHPSLLPKYRGPSPTTYPLILGDKKTGVTLMKMDAKMDHGPIIDAVEFDIPADMKRPELEKELTNLGYELFKKSVLAVIPGSDQESIQNVSPIKSGMTSIHTKPQRHDNATYTKLLTKQDGFIPLPVLNKSFNNDPLTFDELPKLIHDFYVRNPILDTRYSILDTKQVVYNLFRGLFPWPGLWTLVNVNGVEKRLKLIDVSLDARRATSNALHLNTVQLEGKNETNFEEFNSAYKIF